MQSWTVYLGSWFYVVKLSHDPWVYGGCHHRTNQSLVLLAISSLYTDSIALLSTTDWVRGCVILCSYVFAFLCHKGRFLCSGDALAMMVIFLICKIHKRNRRKATCINPGIWKWCTPQILHRNFNVWNVFSCIVVCLCWVGSSL